ncbi:hypothetical protein [Pedobacter gandavensis]|uniref:Uncharacterized protein n=1 Tax=Pedobacter gandavensis TaxID=2679963 RepID=A0ABR6EZJ8_9SPHI|nr:hypothetical protein [Pedobacter gandavensis]MBB2150669.1 hypothetical protein [Pedobacter gandavensis]
MNPDIIKKYGIEFENKLIEEWGVEKIPHTNLDALTFFLHGWNADELDEILLPDINNALGLVDSEIENANDFVTIIINNYKVFFYWENKPTSSIPTIDFKQIVEGWRAFLLSPPLNRSK